MPQPELKQFLKDAKKIYGEGNLHEAFKYVLYAINNDKMPDGSPVTYEIIMARFKDHVDQWNQKYGDRESKYLKESERKELVDLFSFVSRKMFKREFVVVIAKKSRDAYLFPNLPTDELQERLKRFEERNC